MIQVNDLTKTYPGGVRALDGISFSVGDGEIFALLGPNGAGKSTTVRILTTLSTPDGGSASVAGHDVVREAGAVRRSIGSVAQSSGVDLLATGRENLELQARIFRLPPAERTRRVEELLELFGLAEAAARKVKTYSGGMKRRLDVAMGLIHRPRVLFLDEPTTGLDPESRAAMWREVRRLATGGLTILLTTHYLEEADELAGRVAIVDRGRIVAEGEPERLKAELRGDQVTVELEEPGRAAEALGLLEGLDGLHEVMADGGRIFAQAEGGARRIPTVVSTLEGAGLAVAQIALSRPSLDDVYLHATGHAWSEESEAAAGAGPARRRSPWGS